MGNNVINSSKSGVDIYLYMDLSIIEADIRSAEYGTHYVYGKAIRGWASSGSRCVDEYRKWIRTAYLETVRTIVGSLSLKDNKMSVSIMGHDPYLICDLTNDRDALMNCIDVREFVLSNDSDGKFCVSHISTFNPYEEICKKVKQSRTSHPKRKVLGIVITQSSKAFYRFSSEKGKIEQSVRDCESENIEIITIGIRDADANHDDLIKIDEIKAFSTNKQDSVVCDYKTMLRHLKKIAEEKGGLIDYWWETTHTSNWEERVKLLREGYLKEDAFCANEYGKLCYYCIYVIKIRQKNYLVRGNCIEDWESARKCFEVATKKGVSEAKGFLEKETIPKDYECKFLGNLISQIEIFDEPTDEGAKKEIATDLHKLKVMSVISMIIGIINIFSKVSFLVLFLAVSGLVLGMKGRKRGGEKYAIVGIVLNSFDIFVCAISLLTAFIL